VPKIIVVLGLSLAVFAVLCYPLDVANRKACSSQYSPSACNYTLPMYNIWLALFICILVWSMVVCPWTMFFYEADSEL
jgi:LMBR1 domain-containing protein 1